jgi:hypothetical protein
MKRHPPKVSRKKLKAEIDMLKKQVLTANYLTVVTANMAGIQMAAMQASFISKSVRESMGEGVEIKQNLISASFELQSRVEDLAFIVKNHNSKNQAQSAEVK